MRITRALVIASMLAVPAAASAGERVLELAPKASAAQVPIGVCDILHEIYPSYCQYWHVIGVEVATLQPGTSFVAENESGKVEFKVAWTGTNLYLEDGGVMLARGSQEGSLSSVTDMSAQKELLVSGWADNDRDGALSAGDGISLNGKESKILEMRDVVGVID